MIPQEEDEIILSIPNEVVDEHTTAELLDWFAQQEQRLQDFPNSTSR